MDKILLIKTSAFGDIVQTFPALDYLRNKFPNAQIDWAVESHCSDLVKAHPFVDRTICISTQAWRKSFFNANTWRSMIDFRKKLREVEYDAAFDLQSNIKSGLVLSQTRSRKKVGFGFKTVHEKPNLLFTNCHINPPMDGNIREDYLGLVTAFFGDPNPTSFSNVMLKISEEGHDTLQRIMDHPEIKHGRYKVVVCPGSAWRNKQLTEETLIAFLHLLHQQLNCSFLLVWGSQTERDAVQRVHQQLSTCSHVVEKISLPMLQNLMGMSDLVVAMDSLPLHLAGTTSTPTYSVFGASSADKFKPLGNHHAAFQGSCPYGRTFIKRCPVLRTCPTGACIRSVTGDELYAHFRACSRSKVLSIFEFF